MDRDALRAVMYFCRVAGVAPFRRRDEYRVSSSLVICAKLFIMITATDYVICSATSSILTQKFEYIVALDILRWTCKLFTIIAASVSVFTSSERTLRLMRALKTLDKLNHQILRECRQNTNETKLTILILIFLHVSLVIRCYDLFHNIHSFNFGKISVTSLHVLILCAYYMVNLSEVQLVLFANKTLLSLKLVNDSLEKFKKSQSMNDMSQIHIIKILPVAAWDEVNEVQSSNAPSTADEIRREMIQDPVTFIRQCVLNYVQVCNIITTSTEGDSALIVILMLCYMLHLLSPAYKLILHAITLDPLIFDPNLLLAIYWFITYSASLIAFVDPVHKTQTEMQRLQILVTSLMIKNVGKGDIHNELLLFWRFINLYKPTFFPLGMFNLNRSLIVKIFGSLITYLVIIVTYGPDKKQFST